MSEEQGEIDRELAEERETQAHLAVAWCLERFMVQSHPEGRDRVEVLDERLQTIITEALDLAVAFGVDPATAVRTIADTVERRASASSTSD